MIRVSLRTKILVGSIGLVAILALGLLIPLPGTIRHLLTEELELRGVSVSRQLALEAADAVLTGNIHSLRMHFQELRQSSGDIEYIFLENERGEVLTHTFGTAIPDWLPTLTVVDANKQPVHSMATPSGPILDIAAPVLEGQAGTIHVGLSTRIVDRGVRRITRFVAFVAVAVLLFGIFIAIMFANAVTRPLAELIGMAREVGGGNLDYAVPVKTSDELGDLGRAFNTMAKDLQAASRGREEATRALEREIGERFEVQRDLDESVRFLNSVFDSIRDPLIVLDRNYRIARVNEAYAELKGTTVDRLVDRSCFTEVASRHTVCEGCVVEKTFRSEDPCAKEKRITLPDGSEGWVVIYTYPVFDTKGNLTHVIEYTRNISAQKKTEEERTRLIKELQHLSRTDGLTELLNHRTILDRLVYETRRARRYGSSLSLILCDLDNFKVVNDTHGHHVGDKILAAVSHSISSVVRTSDIVGRYGGDEFILVLPETPNAGARDLGERIRKAVAETRVAVAGGTDHTGVTVSVGVVTYDGTSDTDTLIQRVDEALYHSKREGRNRVFSA